MDTNKYCRHCGRVVREIMDPDEGIAYECKCSDKILTSKDIIWGTTREMRIQQLKAMHKLMTLANDETIYMAWIHIMPDQPTEDDFIDIAMDDEQYNECFNEFVRLIRDTGCRY